MICRESVRWCRDFTEAKVINTNVTLQATVDIVANAEDPRLLVWNHPETMGDREIQAWISLRRRKLRWHSFRPEQRRPAKIRTALRITESRTASRHLLWFSTRPSSCNRCLSLKLEREDFAQEGPLLDTDKSAAVRSDQGPGQSSSAPPEGSLRASLHLFALQEAIQYASCSLRRVRLVRSDIVMKMRIPDRDHRKPELVFPYSIIYKS